MKRDEFKRIFKDFNENYGSFYNPYQTLNLWNYVRKIPASEFKSKLEILMEMSSRAPNLANIKGALKPSLDRAINDSRSNKISDENDCRYCRKTGLITSENKNSEHVVVFRCTFCGCASHLNKALEILAWPPKDVDNWKIIF